MKRGVALKATHRAPIIVAEALARECHLEGFLTFARSSTGSAAPTGHVMIGALAAAASGIRAAQALQASAAEEVANATVQGLAHEAARPERVMPATHAEAQREQSERDAKQRERHDPPGWIWAPGHYQADRNALVPYPGMTLADGMVGTVLARRYGQANKAAFEAAAKAYEETVNLGRRDHPRG